VLGGLFKELPISQVALAELSNDGINVEVPLAVISWYHHISLLPKIKDEAERAFYIFETNMWKINYMTPPIEREKLLRYGDFSQPIKIIYGIYF